MRRHKSVRKDEMIDRLEMERSKKWKVKIEMFKEKEEVRNLERGTGKGCVKVETVRNLIFKRRERSRLRVNTKGGRQC